MDFLNKIVSGAKSIISTVGSTFADFGSAAATGVGDAFSPTNIQSKLSKFGVVNPPLADDRTNMTPLPTSMTIQPDLRAQTIGKSGTQYETFNPAFQSPAFTNPKLGVTQTPTNKTTSPVQTLIPPNSPVPSPFQTPYTPPNLRPATPSQSIARASVPGQRGVDEKGNPIGTSGVSGAAGTSSGQTFNTNNTQSVTGGGGAGGATSSFTGLLGATGSGPALMGLSTPQEEEPDLNVGKLEGEIDVSELQGIRDRTAELLRNPAALSPNDRAELNKNIQALVKGGVQSLKAMQAIPNEPVVDTPAQKNFLLQFPENEQIDIRGRMDDIRRAYKLPEMEGQRVELLTQMQAVGKAYQSVVDDIKKNPDLPKGLARRRLTQVSEEQKMALSQITSQIEVIAMQIDDANKRVDQEFKIFQEEIGLEQARQGRYRDYLKMMIDSGAVSAFNDADIKNWSAATGAPESALRAIKKASERTDVDPYFITSTRDDGTVTVSVLDKNNPAAKPIAQHNLGNVGNQQGSPTGGGGLLSTVEIQRLQKMHPSAGIQYGDTEATALGKINGGIAYTPDEIRNFISGAFSGNVSRTELFTEIDRDPRVKNKAEAQHMVNEIYGTPDNPEKKGVVSSFFSTLFGK